MHPHPHPHADRNGSAACSPAEADPERSRNSFSDRIFEYGGAESKKLGWALALNLAGMVAEIVGGLLTGSISLLSDAGHMFTDSFALFISLAAIVIARNPPCHHRTFGWFRSEILAAFVNSLLLFGVSAWFIAEAWRRLLAPVPVHGPGMLAVGLAGLLINLVSMLILKSHHAHDLNLRGAFLHMLADTVSSVAVVAGATVIILGGSPRIDPLLSIGISLAILVWAWGLFRESSRILLEMAPPGVDVDTVAGEIAAGFPEVAGLYNVHFWAITSRMYVFSAHLRLRDHEGDDRAGRDVTARISAWLKERYPIVESTIQWIH
jgi:cobalt-zinc-cadmium efflux system protein